LIQGKIHSLSVLFWIKVFAECTVPVFPDQCCGAGAESRGAEIKLPPEAEAEITNCGSGSSSGSFLFITDLKKFYRKSHGR
jgi:hypothetical protein